MALTRDDGWDLMEEAEQYTAMLPHAFLRATPLEPHEKQQALKQCQDMMKTITQVIEFIQSNH
jgi:hypothetical protein